ncbi:hypothetical protein HJA87_15840 [Rhizobium bangladeshense]|uniref:Uncharacterized protein n=1 Tax=Rhizobium bangladeshense TaxID=1138189 RepID=A0ABS7LIM3_9HYPH|nr:hypothetical protein [Rhizobium bangladeshense]MBY3591329.1 hypothetical protein [Rhizobium bangladeshense]
MAKHGLIFLAAHAGSQKNRAHARDQLASLVIGFICAVGVALVCVIQFAYSSSVGAHLFIALPPVILAVCPAMLVGYTLACDRSVQLYGGNRPS